MLGFTCPKNMFTCYNYTSADGGPKCLSKEYLCDGNPPYLADYHSCKNGEDEKDCSSNIII